MTEDGAVYYITSSKTDRSPYFLYKSEGGVPIKMAKGKSPTQFDCQIQGIDAKGKSKHGDVKDDRN